MAKDALHGIGGDKTEWKHDIPHVWNADDEAHTCRTWASNLYHFAQWIFR